MEAEAKLARIRGLVAGWLGKQGHDRCWYYPDIFAAIAEELGLQVGERGLPTREEFADGCRRYQEAEFETRKVEN